MNIRYIAALSLALLLSACGQQDDANQPDISQIGSGDRMVLAPHQHAGDFDTHVVHVNALTTDQLSPEVSQNYGITRSRSHALLNVHVEKTGDVSQSSAADVQVIVKNLSNQEKNMTLQEVREDATIYYIGQVSITNGETLVFDIDVTPSGLSETLQLSYRQQFFTE